MLRVVQMDDGTNWRFACTDDPVHPFAVKIGTDPIHPLTAADLSRLQTTVNTMQRLLERKQAFESLG